MSLIKKRDVKNRLAARARSGIHVVRPTAKPVDAGLPSADPAVTEVNEQAFVEDFCQEHCSPGGTVTAAVIVTPEDVQVTETVKITRV